ncbi:MAG: rhomboid family intramembrane serine protease, partial [Cyanobacteria bacterium J06553_1]
QLGRAKFIVFYVSCGILAVMAQWFFSAMSSVPSLGASGAIAGVMGAYILKFPQAKIVTVLPLGIFFPLFRIPAIYFLGFWFIEQALNGISSFNVTASVGMESGGVAYWAHAGGFVAGAILGPMLGLFSDTAKEKSLV